MEILWWLAPPTVATVLAMLWVSWLGREGRGEIDPEVAARRLGRAMARPSRVTPRATPTRATMPGDRSSGIAVRSSTRSGATPASQSSEASDGSEQGGETESTRRAS